MKVKENIKEIQEICHPTKAHKKDIYRKISLYLIKPLLRLGFKADHITILRVIFIISAIILFFSKQYMFAVIAVIFLQLQLLLDTLDGAIARYRKESSTLGEFYDVILDYLCSGVIIIILPGIYIFLINGLSIFLYISIITSILMILSAFLRVIFLEKNINVEKIKKKNNFFRQVNSDQMRLTTLILTLSIIFNIPLMAIYLFAIISLIKIIGQIIYLKLTIKKKVNVFKEMLIYFIIILNILKWIIHKLFKLRFKPIMENSLKNNYLWKQIYKKIEE